LRKAIGFHSRRRAASKSSRLLGDRSYIPVYISGMSRVNDKVSRSLEVPLRALWCKARGGGGRLRQATAREEKGEEKKQEKKLREEKI